MPIIPRYEDQGPGQVVRMPRQSQGMGDAPLVPVNPGALTGGLQAAADAQLTMAKAFDMIRKWGDEQAETGLKMQHISSLAALNRAKVQAGLEMEEFLAGIEERQDYQNVEADYRTKAQEIKGKYREGLSGLYLEKFDSDFDSDAIKTYPKIRKFARAKARDDWYSTLPAMMEQAKQRHLEAPGGRAGDEILMQIDHGVSMGMLSKVEGEKLKAGFGRDLMDIEIKSGIMGAPEMTLNRLKDPNQFPGLDPEVRLGYQERATIRVRQLKSEQEEELVNGAYDGLFKRFGGDPTLIINHLSNPENSRALGLNLKQTAYLTDRFQHLRHEINYQFEQEKKFLAQKDSETVYAYLNKGKLKDAAVFALRSPNLPEESKFRVKEMIERMAAPEGPNKTEIKAQNYTRALIGIRTGKITDLEGLLKTGVYGHDLKSLMDLMDHESKEGKPNEKKINFFERWDREFKELARGVKDSDGKPLEDRKNDFLTSLDWMMRREKLSAYDPQVYEMGRRLFDSVTVEKRSFWWDKTKRGFEVVTEKRPWVSGLDVNTSAFYDPHVPDATQEEMDQVREILQKNKLAATPLTKRRALLAVRQGEDISKITINAPSQEIPKAAQARIEKLLKRQGQKVTPANIKHIWDNYGDQIFQE